MEKNRDLREEVLGFIAKKEPLELTQKRFGLNRERLKELILGTAESIDIYIDGAARGNPGPAGAGVVFIKDNKIKHCFSEFLGNRTNNQAEYLSLILALEKAKEFGYKKIRIKTDSQLISRQIKGLYKTKNGILLKLLDRAKRLLLQFDSWEIIEIPRKENSKADRLARDASRAREGDRVPFSKERDEESPDSSGHGTS